MGRNTSQKISQKDLNKWIDLQKKSGKFGQEIPLGEVPGFHARFNKTFISLRLNYKDECNLKKTITIGHYPNMTLTRGIQKAREEHGKIINGFSKTIPNQNNVTLKKYLEKEYMTYLNALKSGRSIYLSIHKHFKNLLNTPLLSINRQHIMSWKISMEASNYSAQTIKSTYKTLRALINHAVENEIININPIKYVKLGRFKNNTESHNEKRKALTNDEVNAFFKGVEAYGQLKIEQRNRSIKHGKKHLRNISKDYFADHNIPIFYILYFTGMRPGDVLSLQWHHIDFNNAEISKVLNKTEHSNQVPVKIPICNELQEILKKWHLQNNKPNAGVCFQNPTTNKQLTKWSIYKPWEHIKKLGGLNQNLQPYALRHNFISQLLKANENIFTICKIVGHKNTDMIMKHYGHLSPSVAQNAVSKIQTSNFQLSYKK